jgi:LysM repeat protein
VSIDRKNKNSPILYLGGKKTRDYVSRAVFIFVFTMFPLSARADFLSSIKTFFGFSDVKADEKIMMNAQTAPLLESKVSVDSSSSTKSVDNVAVVNGSALLSEEGPMGGASDLAEKTEAGHISLYVVRDGDSLASIAKMFGVSKNTIIWANDLKGASVHEGDTLVILPISGVKKIVEKGDTLKSLAKKYRADEKEIAQYNDIPEDGRLAVGDEIIIPDGEIAPSAVSASKGSKPTSKLRGANGPEFAGYYIRPLTGGKKTQGLHGYNGVDLANYYGAPVMASASGVVMISKSYGWNGGYGNYIVIQHGNGTQTLYGHLSGNNVTAGQMVSQGDVIGYLGNSGKSTGPHLHFEIRGAKNPF